MRKQIMTALLTLSLVGTLSSCSLVGFWLSGCGGEKADLVVVNESSAVIDGISVTEGSQTQSVSSEDGSGLLECGESYGLELAGTGECVVVLFGPQLFGVSGGAAFPYPEGLGDHDLYHGEYYEVNE